MVLPRGLYVGNRQTDFDAILTPVTQSLAQTIAAFTLVVLLTVVALALTFRQSHLSFNGLKVLLGQAKEV